MSFAGEDRKLVHTVGIIPIDVDAARKTPNGSEMTSEQNYRRIPVGESLEVNSADKPIVVEERGGC